MSRWIPTVVMIAAPGVILLGAAAVWLAYGPDGHLSRTDGAYPGILDLLTGYVFLAAGVAAGVRRPRSLVGPLFMLTAVFWFIGTLVEPSRFVGTALAPSVVFLYRGPLIHAIVTFPTGRPTDRVEWLAVLAGYGLSFVAPMWFQPLVGLALLCLLVGVALRAYRRAGRTTRPARREALAAAALLALTAGLISLGRALDAPDPLGDAMTIGFHLVLMAVVLRLTLRLVHSDRPDLTDVVVDLTGGSVVSLGAELSRLLGDPSLRIGTWDPQRQVYVDGAGSAIDAGPKEGRALLRVDRDGLPLAAVEHGRGTLADVDLRDAVVDAVRLAVANTRLRAQVRGQVDELAASRRRLVVAGDAAGERLAGRLRDGAMRRLETAGDHLRDADGAAADAGADVALAAIERARARLVHVADDLHDFALGLDPRSLTERGLTAALTELARDCPLTVELHCDVSSVPQETATAAFLVCAEALANATKHAQASAVRIEVSAVGGSLSLRVIDDGIGGAIVGSGHGLRNIADRVASLGGRLSVKSSAGLGTILDASMPLAVETRKDFTPILPGQH